MNKERIFRWLKNPYNIVLLLILILAFGIRIYNYSHTSTQPLWYDEGDYLSTAKHWALHIPYTLNEHRPPLFQFLAAIAFMVGFGESFIRLFLVLLPSVLLVLFVYLLGKEMYNEKIGLIAAFLTSVSWTLLFWTARIQPDFFSLCFSVLSFLFIWKYWKSPKTKLAVWSGIFACLGFQFKVSGLLVPLIIAVFILVRDRISAFKNKDYYLFALSFILTLVPYMIWSKITFGTATAFRGGYSNALVNASPFAWGSIKYFYLLTDNLSIFLFILGAIIALKFILYLDVLIKDKSKCFDAGLFSIISIIIVWAFYIFYIRAIEDRWVFLGLPFIFLLIGSALVSLKDFIKRYNKGIAIALVIILVVISGYFQLTHANQLIDNKKDSYVQIKDAALWMKGQSVRGDRIFTISNTQTMYYSERESLIYSEINKSDFLSFVDKERPKFLEISAFEAHPVWLNEWVGENQNILSPVQVYYADTAKTQPILVIYQIQYMTVTTQ